MPAEDIEIERLKLEQLDRQQTREQQDRQNLREFVFRIILVLVPTSAQMGSIVLDWNRGDRQMEIASSVKEANEELKVAAKDRTEIAKKIDEHTVKLDEAAEHAKVAATEVKAVAAKINTMGDAQPADSPQ